MNRPLVAFTGPRDLPETQRPLVWSVVQAVVRAGRGVAVGDAPGADRLVATFARQAHAPLQVFSPPAPQTVSWCTCFTVTVTQPPVVDRFSRPHQQVAVSFQAPAQPHIVSHTSGGRTGAELARRSARMVAAAVASGPGAGLVAFVAAPCPVHPRSGKPLLPSPSSVQCFGGFGSGTWSTLALAVGLRLPVVVFLSGLGRAALPTTWGGLWVSAGPTGPWVQGYRFVRCRRAVVGHPFPQPWAR